MTDVLALTSELIRRRSVTPHDEECQALIAGRLQQAGFECERLRFGDVDNPVQSKDFNPRFDGRLSNDFVAVKQNLYQYDANFPKPPATFTDPFVNLGPDADQVQTADGTLPRSRQRRLPSRA